MNSLKILVIEDESLIALELSETIKSFGYPNVDYVTTVDKVQNIINSKKINLLVMDINLNDKITGIELYKKLNTQIPIIYSTAYRDDKTMSKAIATTPLGYLIKPINDDELKALLKLAEYKIISLNNIIRLNKEYLFNLNEDKLFYQNNYINLGKKELELLKLLLNANESTISFERIEDEIWKNRVVSSSAVRTLIYRLRGKLGHQFIETEFNYGIKLIKSNK